MVDLLEFNISGSGKEHVDLSYVTQLYVKVKFVKYDASYFPEDEPMGPVNLFLHSVFSSQHQFKLILKWTDYLVFE